jgi:hypothetical protein
MIRERTFRERDSVDRDFALAMMEPNHTRFCAGAAIAAALALSSAPLLAQVAEAPPPAAPDPVLTIPATPAPSPAQPTPPQSTIVLPTDLPQAAPPEAEAVAPEPAPRAAARAERPVPRAVAPVAAPDPEPVAAAEDLAPIAAEPIVEPAAPVATAEPVATIDQPGSDNTQFWVAVLAGLAAIALAIWGFIAIGRRKPADRKAALMIERPIVKPREPVAAEPTPSVSPLHAPAPSMAHTGAAVPLPGGVPATFEERDALIKRMIAAKPDRANPFTSPIQRRKRAKLILQSIGRDFGDQEPWIDLSQYPQNWPDLAARKQAAA